MGLPQPAQKCTPGAFCRPQLVQMLLAGAAVGAGVAPDCTLAPQFVQKVFAIGISAWQAGQVRVIGCEGAVAATACKLSDEPQCIQKAAPGLTASLQRGQIVVVAAGLAIACTGVPHC